MIIKKNKNWKEVKVSKGDSSTYLVFLDENELKTELGNLLELPKTLANALANEWRKGKKVSEIRKKFFTKFCSSVFDHTIPYKLKVLEKIVEYANCDLICYLAENPENLIDKQKELLSKYVDWANTFFAIKLRIGRGISYVEQDGKNGRIIRAYLAELNDFQVTLIYELTNLTGSFFISVALFNKEFEPGDAWKASTIEDSYRIDLWGQIEEEMEIINEKEKYFLSLVKLIDRVS